MALVDYDESPEVFEEVGVNSVPKFMIFPPKGKPKPHDTLDSNNKGYGSDAIAQWIKTRTEVPITLITPPDYSKIFKILGAICLVAMIIYFLGDKIMSKLEPIFKSTTLWGLLVLAWVLKMIGGHMWNVIRTPPNHGYGPEYINGSQSYQYLYETYLVAGKNTLILVKVFLC